MAYSGTISQSADGKTLTWNDTSTIVAPLTSKILVITDSNNVVLQTTSMGSLTTATFIISADQCLTFTMTLTDNAGVHIVVESYLSIRFFMNTYVSILKTLGCGCYSSKQYCKLNQAYELKIAAEYYAPLTSYGVLANSNIVDANTILNS